MNIPRVLPFAALVAGAVACATPKSADTGADQALDDGSDDSDSADGGDGAADGDDGSADGDDGTADGGDGGDPGPDPFADRVVDMDLGPAHGFGLDAMPDIVLGAPEGGGDVGSLDVLSLGCEGWIVLGFDDIGIVDGPGPDLLVFENPFPGWTEHGVVAVSDDGETWSEWPCDPAGDGAPGCAGETQVWATSDNGVDPTDPEAAGGDAFDLAELGLGQARFVRIRDTGSNSCDGESGGFDLDAIAVVNGAALD